MKLPEKIKIKLWLTRFSYEDLTAIKKFIDEEYDKRKKKLKKIKDN